MSPLVKTDVPEGGAEEALKFENAPYGTYDLLATVIDLGTTKTDRPMWIVEQEIVECSDPKFNGIKMRSWLVVPSGGNNRGCKAIRDFTIACGKPWNGGDINNDDYVGKRFKAIVKIGDPNDKGETYNEIESYVVPK